MKKSWLRSNFSSAFLLQSKCLFVPLLFIASVVVMVSYFAVSYVVATEKQLCTSGVCPLTNQSSDFVNVISLEELKEEIDNNDDLLIINVLNKDYYRKAHIPDSINIPVKDVEKFKKTIKKKLHKKKISKDTPIVVYCASSECTLSEQAYTLLTQEFEFTNVRDFKGGIKAWQDAGNEVEEE